jgi:hypothetical protein
MKIIGRESNPVAYKHIDGVDIAEKIYEMHYCGLIITALVSKILNIIFV